MYLIVEKGSEANHTLWPLPFTRPSATPLTAINQSRSITERQVAWRGTSQERTRGSGAGGVVCCERDGLTTVPVRVEHKNQSLNDFL